MCNYNFEIWLDVYIFYLIKLNLNKKNQSEKVIKLLVIFKFYFDV